MIFLDDYEIPVLEDGKSFAVVVPPIDALEAMDDAHLPAGYQFLSTIAPEQGPLFWVDEQARRVALLAVGDQHAHLSVVLEDVAPEVLALCQATDPVQIFEVNDDGQLLRAMLAYRLTPETGSRVA